MTYEHTVDEPVHGDTSRRPDWPLFVAQAFAQLHATGGTVLSQKQVTTLPPQQRAIWFRILKYRSTSGIASLSPWALELWQPVLDYMKSSSRNKFHTALANVESAVEATGGYLPHNHSLAPWLSHHLHESAKDSSLWWRDTFLASPASKARVLPKEAHITSCLLAACVEFITHNGRAPDSSISRERRMYDWLVWTRALDRKTGIPALRRAQLSYQGVSEAAWLAPGFHALVRELT